jgi:hypothetical protein
VVVFCCAGSQLLLPLLWVSGKAVQAKLFLGMWAAYNADKHKNSQFQTSLTFMSQ